VGKPGRAGGRASVLPGPSPHPGPPTHRGRPAQNHPLLSTQTAGTGSPPTQGKTSRGGESGKLLAVFWGPTIDQKERVPQKSFPGLTGPRSGGPAFLPLFCGLGKGGECRLLMSIAGRAVVCGRVFLFFRGGLGARLENPAPGLARLGKGKTHPAARLFCPYCILLRGGAHDS